MKHLFNKAPYIILFSCFLLLLLISAIAVTHGHNTTRIATVDTCSDRVAILLAGIDSEYLAGDSERDDVYDTFADIIAKVLPDFDYKRVIYYSYRPGSPTEYDEQDTFVALPDRGVQALHEMIQHEINNCQDAQIDLIGHSLGGAVALEYMSQYRLRPDTEEVRHIKHFVSLDSPLNGTSHDKLVDLFSLVPFDISLLDFLQAPVAIYLAERHEIGVVGLNISLAKTLSEYTVIGTLYSIDDFVVPFEDARIEGFAYGFSLGKDLLRCGLPDGFLWFNTGLCAGHAQVLREDLALDAIRRVLQSSPSSTPTPIPPPPAPCSNAAAFVTDVTYPDGSALSPGQSFNKTWRLQNTGTCTWSGYTLAFVSGVQMGGPASVAVPDTGRDKTVDITVPLVAPQSGGTYRGDWRLKDPQGVYFGDQVWVIITVPPAGDSCTPTADQVALFVDINYIGQCVVKGIGEYPNPGAIGLPNDSISSLWVGANVKAVLCRDDGITNTCEWFERDDSNLSDNSVGNDQVSSVRVERRFSSDGIQLCDETGFSGECQTYTYTNNSTCINLGGMSDRAESLRFQGSYVGNYEAILYSDESCGTYIARYGQDASDLGGLNNQTSSMRIEKLILPPPTLTSPPNWSVSRDGSTPKLCASAPAGLEYFFKIFEGHQTPDSSWISSNCWTPPTLGPYTFQWHAKVRDPAAPDLESGWSETRHFSIDAQEITIDDFEFSKESLFHPDDVRIYTCAHGFGGFLSMKIEANYATDRSTSGEWQMISQSFNPASYSYQII